jgi:hypothetical protein
MRTKGVNMDFKQPPYFSYCLNCGDIRKDYSNLMYCGCRDINLDRTETTSYLFRDNLGIIEYLFRKHLDRKLNWHSKPVMIWKRASKKQVEEYITAKLV